MSDGMIVVDSPVGARWGFVRERFSAISYLWRDGDRVLVSFIDVREQARGYFRDLVQAIEADGLRVAIPTPLWHMEAILRHWGWVPHVEDFRGEGVTVWERRPILAEGEEVSGE